MFHFIVVEGFRRSLLFLKSIGFTQAYVFIALISLPFIYWKPWIIFPVVSCVQYWSFRRFNILRGKEPKLVGKGFARMFFSLVENAFKGTSKEALKEAVANYKKNQMIDNCTFHDDKVLILFPDLLKCDELPIIYGMEKMELERKKFSNLMICVMKGDENLKIPYECRGAKREMEYAVFVLTRSKETDLSKKKEYFICLDNRPLVNLKDANMTAGDLQIEQKAFYDEICLLMDSHSDEKNNYRDRFELLKFSGDLSATLDEYSNNKTRISSKFHM